MLLCKQARKVGWHLRARKKCNCEEKIHDNQRKQIKISRVNEKISEQVKQKSDEKKRQKKKSFMGK